MKNIIKALILILTVFFSSCNTESIEGSAKMIEKEFDFKDFDNISITNSFDVTLIQSHKFKVELECNENIEQYLNINKEGKTLNLNMESNKSFNNVTCKATVYMPSLNFVKATGASKINITDFNLEKNKLKLELLGATKLNGNIVANNLTIDTKGASAVYLTGSAESGSIITAGATKISAKDFAFNELNFKSYGASKVLVHIIDELNAELSGASRLNYYGNPHVIKKEVNGVGKINHLED